ncbi:MAG: hypothetical protein K0M63_11415 [Weeksellaceae bacterium]|nr:hypothetical protein [Weeksellaceae bacterium]
MNSTITFFLLILFQLASAQRDYTFNYHSLYDAGQKSETRKPAEVSVYDSSNDTSYQMIVYPQEARIRDEGRSEMHYFRVVKENDSIQFKYDYSLKVLFAPDFEINSVHVKKINDIDYEISYVKKNQKMQSREKMEICLQEFETDLLNTGYTELSKKETGLLVNSLRKSITTGRKYYIASNLHTSGRYQFLYDRRLITPVNLTLSLPAQVIYKNSFLKN